MVSLSLEEEEEREKEKEEVGERRRSVWGLVVVPCGNI